MNSKTMLFLSYSLTLTSFSSSGILFQVDSSNEKSISPGSLTQDEYSLNVDSFYCEALKDFSPPDDSNCWDWNLSSDAHGTQVGCDYKACAEAVCACDKFCCENIWDLSCRGYKKNPTDNVNDNPFVPGCSASILCCEKETNPKPIGDCTKTGFFPPPDSSCWQWNEIIDGKQVGDQRGCDFNSCQNAVCACDSYCCDVSWDLACRGYKKDHFTDLKDNYFVPGCSASILCCEPDDAFPPSPDPPNPIPERKPITTVDITTSSTCIVDRWRPPNDSNCWKYNVALSDKLQIGNQKGCDFQLCQDAVCACDSYCCNVSWDLSCRGYQQDTFNDPKDNFFFQGCSAALLCCEHNESQPKPPNPPNAVPLRPCKKCDPEIIPFSTESPSATTDETITLPIPILETINDSSCEIIGWRPPNDSTCWQWNKIISTKEKEGSQKGCDFELCQEEVCSCDPYCCEVSWDLSCRGGVEEGVNLDSNFFSSGCSASILCCETKDSYPKPPKSLTQLPLRKEDDNNDSIVSSSQPTMQIIIELNNPSPMSPPPPESKAFDDVGISQVLQSGSDSESFSSTESLSISASLSESLSISTSSSTSSPESFSPSPIISKIPLLSKTDHPTGIKSSSLPTLTSKKGKNNGNSKGKSKGKATGQAKGSTNGKAKGKSREDISGKSKGKARKKANDES